MNKGDDFGKKKTREPGDAPKDEDFGEREREGKPWKVGLVAEREEIAAVENAKRAIEKTAER